MRAAYCYHAPVYLILDIKFDKLSKAYLTL